MITEETKLKELIPEGYELETTGIVDILNKNQQFVTIPIKKKEVRAFNWYVKEYISNKLTNYYFRNVHVINQLFNDKAYSYLPFEIKIGLLKIIAEDVNDNYILFLTQYPNVVRGTKSIINICPPEFLTSILK